MNCGDAYAGAGVRTDEHVNPDISKTASRNGMVPKKDYEHYKPEDLMLIPTRVAMALQADRRWLRSEIVWAKCLSGGTRVYARTQKGDMPMTVREMSRLNPSTVKLWSGSEWLQVHSITETVHEETMEIRFRTGESVGCSLEHRWPTTKGIKHAMYLNIGDVIETATLPDNHKTVESIPDCIAYVIGLYIAEGSKGKGGKQIQFSLHRKEKDFTERIKGRPNTTEGIALSMTTATADM